MTHFPTFTVQIDDLLILAYANRGVFYCHWPILCYKIAIDFLLLQLIELNK